MGQWIAKLTGDDKTQDAQNRAAEDQATATRAAAEKTAKATQEAAAQATRQMELSAARNKLEMSAAEQATKPMENADVLLDNPATSSPTVARKRRSQFGTGYSAGVNI